MSSYKNIYTIPNGFGESIPEVGSKAMECSIPN